jgi:hypothetical protein
VGRAHTVRNRSLRGFSRGGSCLIALVGNGFGRDLATLGRGETGCRVGYLVWMPTKMYYPLTDQYQCVKVCALRHERTITFGDR